MHTTTALLADGPWHGGPWFLLFPLFWLFFLVIVFTVLRRTGWRRGWGAGCYDGGGYGRGPQGPLAVLGRRYADGEIDEQEYRARRAVLIEQAEGPQLRKSGGRSDGKPGAGAR